MLAGTAPIAERGSSTDPRMNVELQPLPAEDRPVLERLTQLYLHDFTEFQPNDVDESGLFADSNLGRYWAEAGRWPFAIRVDGRLAGFVLVSPHSPSGQPTDHTVAEFFIMRQYRRMGVGRIAAREVFDRLPGVWEVAEIAANLPAQAFWRAVIDEYTAGDYREFPDGAPSWNGPIQRFRAPPQGQRE